MAKINFGKQEKSKRGFLVSSKKHFKIHKIITKQKARQQNNCV